MKTYFFRQTRHVCVKCGVEFTSPSRIQKYCNACRGRQSTENNQRHIKPKTERKQPKVKDKKCELCGRPIEPDRCAASKYCYSCVGEASKFRSRKYNAGLTLKQAAARARRRESIKAKLKGMTAEQLLARLKEARARRAPTWELAGIRAECAALGLSDYQMAHYLPALKRHPRLFRPPKPEKNTGRPKKPKRGNPPGRTKRTNPTPRLKPKGEAPPVNASPQIEVECDYFEI